MTTAPHLDKSEWPNGPWMDEPDRLEWRAHGLPCLIVRNPIGALCGYVGLLPGHPWRQCDGPEDVPCRVHGGPTYLARCDERAGICHVPREGETDDVVWLGFDCAHAGDFVPGLGLPGFLGSYRDIDDVRAEVERLTEQVVEAAE